MNSRQVLALFTALGWVTFSARSADAPRSIEGVLTYQFYLGGSLPLTGDAAPPEERVFILSLALSPEKCISLDCHRICVGEGMPLALQVSSPLLQMLRDRDEWISIERRFVGREWDDEIETVCPQLGTKTFIDLRYRVNKWDIAAAVGGISGSMTAPKVAQLRVAMEFFSFVDGQRTEAGTLVSDPFFARVSDTVFMMSELPDGIEGLRAAHGKIEKRAEPGATDNPDQRTLKTEKSSSIERTQPGV